MSELWDLYNGDRQPIHKMHERGKPMVHGEYHIVVNIWTVHSDGRILITKRDPNKKYGGMWECTGGSVLSGEDSITGACRELREETGISAEPEELRLIHSAVMPDRFVDTYIVQKKADTENLRLQPGEVVDAKLVSFPELENLFTQKKMVPAIAHRWSFYRDEIAALAKKAEQ